MKNLIRINTRLLTMTLTQMKKIYKMMISLMAVRAGTCQYPKINSKQVLNGNFTIKKPIKGKIAQFVLIHTKLVKK